MMMDNRNILMTKLNEVDAKGRTLWHFTADIVASAEEMKRLAHYFTVFDKPIEDCDKAYVRSDSPLARNNG